MRATSARRRAATTAVSPRRPMTGSSGTGVHAPSGAGAGGAWAGAAVVTPSTKKSPMRMGSEAIARLGRRQRLDSPSGGATNYAMTVPSAPTSADAKRLTTRVAELERERKHLFIADAASDPSLKHVKGEFISRRVKSITVVPITWRGAAIGAIFLRTFRDGSPFSEADMRFVQEIG